MEFWHQKYPDFFPPEATTNLTCWVDFGKNSWEMLGKPWVPEIVQHGTWKWWFGSDDFPLGDLKVRMLIFQGVWIRLPPKKVGKISPWIAGKKPFLLQPQNGGLEDDFPVRTGDFWVQHANFAGCKKVHVCFLAAGVASTQWSIF